MTDRPLEGRFVVLGVTGGIAAYKAVEVCRLLVDDGAHVAPVLTEDATRFIGALTFSALASEPARTALWGEGDVIPHTRLGQSADVIVVAPATARFISSYATGLSDGLLTATVIATRAPVIVCPAMHTEMWEHPAVQENIATLRRRGVSIVGPDEGRLAGGDIGAGRMVEPAEIVAAVASVLRNAGGTTSSGGPGARVRDLEHVHVLVSAGGTREPIDPGPVHHEPVVRKAGPRNRGGGGRQGSDREPRDGGHACGSGGSGDGKGRYGGRDGIRRSRAGGGVGCRDHGGGGLGLPPEGRSGREAPQAGRGARDPAGADHRHPGRGLPATPSRPGPGRVCGGDGGRHRTGGQKAREQGGRHRRLQRRFGPGSRLRSRHEHGHDPHQRWRLRDIHRAEVDGRRLCARYCDPNFAAGLGSSGRQTSDPDPGGYQ